MPPQTFLTRATLMDAVAVASTGSAESLVLDLRHVATLESISVRASSASAAADVKIEYALSPDGTNFGSFDDTTDFTASTATDFANNTEGFNTIFPPTTAPMNFFVKLKVTGVGANAADTLVTLYAVLREGGK